MEPPRPPPSTSGGAQGARPAPADFEEEQGPNKRARAAEPAAGGAAVGAVAGAAAEAVAAGAGRLSSAAGPLWPGPSLAGPGPSSAAAAANTASAPATVQLGGVSVCAVGLGCLPAGVLYPDPSRRPDAATFRAIVAAAAAAAAPARLLIDTADTYCVPHTDRGSLERDLAVASAELPAGTLPLVLTTKSGMMRVSDESSGWRPGDASPTGVRGSILAARKALGGAHIGPGPAPPPVFLWSLHHTDGLAAPGRLEAALQAAVACVREGQLLHIGLCNASVPLIERALAITPILTVQNEYSLYQREAEKPRPPGAAASSKKGVLRFCAQKGIVFVAYAPLGGLKARRGERGLERDYPAVAKVAAARGVSAAAVALAALRQRGAELGAALIPIAGARTAAHATDSVESARLVLSEAEVAAVMGPVAA